jgi:hypothetical protein
MNLGLVFTPPLFLFRFFSSDAEYFSYSLLLVAPLSLPLLAPPVLLYWAL